jgi:hypothetical protein
LIANTSSILPSLLACFHVQSKQQFQTAKDYHKRQQIPASLHSAKLLPLPPITTTTKTQAINSPKYKTQVINSPKNKTQVINSPINKTHPINPSTYKTQAILQQTKQNQNQSNKKFM